MKVEIKKVKETKFPSHCLSLVLGDDKKIYASCYDGGVYCLDDSEKKPKKIVTHENISQESGYVVIILSHQIMTAL